MRYRQRNFHWGQVQQYEQKIMLMSILHELLEYSKNTEYYKANTFFQSVELPYAIDYKNDPSNYSKHVFFPILHTNVLIG